MSSGLEALLNFLVGEEPWMAEGTCHKEHAPVEVFILEQGHTAHEAKSYCDRCPVQRQCLRYARRSGSVGVWGGKVFSFKAEVPDVAPAPVSDIRPVIKKVVLFEEGKAPGIFGGVANFQKPGIFG